MQSVQADLDAALPLVEKAKAALEGLNIDDFRNLKALKTPPAAVANTLGCCLHLLAVVDKNVPVNKKGQLQTDKPW
jgi:dynein heavy chain